MVSGDGNTETVQCANSLEELRPEPTAHPRESNNNNNLSDSTVGAGSRHGVACGGDDCGGSGCCGGTGIQHEGGVEVEESRRHMEIGGGRRR